MISKKLRLSIEYFLKQYYEDPDKKDYFLVSKSVTRRFDEEGIFADIESIIPSPSQKKSRPTAPIHVETETFATFLFKLIDKSGLSDVEVYQPIGITRQHFSKIRSKTDYQPSKDTAIMFCFPLRLNESDSRKLLEYAGFAFQPNSYRDALLLSMIRSVEIIDIEQLVFTINEILVEYHQDALFFKER
jgi:O-acetyl-ADP-ribose deacetylase